ncbi:phosphatase PAP2 family protein [Streptomyces sp. SP18CS02]|uniref:phosphatase PAP2 family protein n=1 Tax=Streptomyces sp. SP18CS02 TaxID=3002531 RepID=UPI002E7820EA|nr:phosphatase PAP2 family protein [Streptomyces sp. SP18CS02]MEE1755355.1 phosphatase PAP2 family protein [Streptomyces sp. SP18CS02]
MPSTALPPSRAPSAAVAAACSGALAVLLLVLVMINWAPLIAMDRAVADDLHDSAVRDPGLTQTNRVLSDWVWDPWTMRALVAVTVVWLWRHAERLLAVWLGAVTVLSSALQQLLKAAVGRERPQWPDPVDTAHFAAFPSGHAMTATVTCGLLLWVLARSEAGSRLWLTAVTLAAVSVLGVGLTRMYLGVHWFSDVVGGWLLGVCVVALAVVTYDRAAMRAVLAGRN